MPERTIRPVHVAVLVSGVILAAASGLLLEYLGTRVGVALLACVAAILIARRPTWGMYLIAFTIPIENMVLVVPGLSGTRLVGYLVALVWFVQKIARRESWRSVIETPFVLWTVLFLSMILASAIWATYLDVVGSGFVRLLGLFAWSLLVLDLTRSWAIADRLAKALTLGACTAVLFTLSQFFFSGLRRAGEDIAGGANATAVVLVTLLPMGFYVLRTARPAFWKIVGVVTVFGSVLSVAVSFSRMNMLLLPLLLVAMYWHTLRGRGGRVILLGVTVAGIIAMTTLLPWDRLQSRAETIRPYIEGTLTGETRVGSVESPRGYHIRVGLAIARDHPLIGAGYGNYGYLFRDEYQFSLPGSDRVYTSPRSPHTSFVGILADLGVIGLALWLAILGSVSIAVAGAWRRTMQARSSAEHVLVQATAYGLALHVLAYSWYLPNQREKIVWTLFGIGLAVAALSRPRSAQLPEPAGKIT